LLSAEEEEEEESWAVAGNGAIKWRENATGEKMQGRERERGREREGERERERETEREREREREREKAAADARALRVNRDKIGTLSGSARVDKSTDFLGKLHVPWQSQHVVLSARSFCVSEERLLVQQATSKSIPI
jgi:hypothetical protein